ncbi:sodium:solute symporter family protein [Acinetobacter indicus]|uniref:sodium:solute symporter family protein n=2 Tax=Acinetobacter indicus TaxID=756892 RepID=UPI000CEC050B|nr:sodium:solute symporter family protein [Acinetobacter indicus]MCO8086779.1 sodium:solute symporter family protein [Acinetobacter indicus]MCO8098717.1 sodium:solute symporter family protein [Acinetobacter indicus]MCO8104382.1 sodium:solute symporter family protein [Acinetobacter indicus]MCO8109995.1 sodium:solute symporter family protein [Acinetobacter indicus]MDM1245698.1 sodium:solute symporter family protein [Acinetobacter indicus]
MFQFTSTTTVLLMVLFYGITFLLSLRIKQKNENVDGYMVSNSSIGFGMSAASMTATWIWAASFYAAASSGYKYGVSGALHYGLWGALMILFIYPFGKRFRELAPNAHTLAEIMHARHGNQSQMILAGSNIVGSVISLMVNFTAAGALVEILSPLSFVHGVLITGIGVLSYTLWSGFRSSVFTDFGQLVAMIVAAVIIIPTLFFTLGGPSLFQTGIHNLQPEQLDFFSKTAFLEQGAPFFVAVLAYAIGNQTIAQRLFAVREDLIKPSFITATIGYAAIVIGLGMLGLLALFAGIQPIDGNLNNLIPQMAATYLSPFMVALLFIMVIGALSSTADSDLSALSAIVMTDIYGKQIAKNQPNPKKMLFIGRMTMIVATMLGIIIATLKFDILSMLIFVGALWGSIVFPVIVSLYWDKVNARAFNWSVGLAFVSFLIVRFEWIPIQGLIALGFELLATLGIGVVLGLMTFGFFGKKVGLVVGILASIGFMPWTIGFLREYGTLLSSLTAYGSSALVCTVLTLVYSKERFDFKQINKMVIEFHQLSEKSK